MESSRYCGKKKTTAVPVLPPRIPTPMPPPNNNNSTRSSRVREQNTKVHPSSVGLDIPKLISKDSHKLLDNDVKTAWINPRLISKIDMNVITSAEYMPPEVRNMNGYYNHNLSHQKQGCGRAHDREWESAVNGRAKPRVVAVPTLTQSVEDAKRDKADRRNSRAVDAHNIKNINSESKTFKPAHIRSHMESAEKLLYSSHSRACTPSSKSSANLPKNKQMHVHQSHSRSNVQRALPVEVQKVKGVVGYQSRVDYVGGGFVGHDSGVFGMYSETRYAFAVNGLPGNPAQASAAAAFFARAAQKLNLSSSPHRRKRHNSEDAEPTGFCGVLQKSPPPVPPALLRRIGVKEVTGVGKAIENPVQVITEEHNTSSEDTVRTQQYFNQHKQQYYRLGYVRPQLLYPCKATLGEPYVITSYSTGEVKVMLRVSTPPGSSSPDNGCSNNFFNLDKRKKQVTLVDPSTCGSAAPEDRRVGVAAPKMFAFDAIFSQDDSQTEVCSSALTDVIHAVINGTDGCLFCFGHAGLGKSYTMLGTPENANTLGIIPCAISWLFRGINEQKQKTGARFSVRVSAVEVSGPSNQLRDLLAGYSNDSEQSPGVYLRDDPLFGNQPPHCELRVPTAERAAHYLDVAVEGRAPTREDSRDSHLLFTLHVYQYSVAGKGGVAGGRSRLHLFDLGNSERGKSSGGIPLSGLGNILLAIFNGQKHLPYKEHKLTHLLKDCLNSLTCHAAMIAHVSPYAQNYSDTLTTVQLASRIHRMRRRRIKFVSAGVGNGSGGSSGEEATRTTGTSSEPDPSSSDLSADTVIYVGPADDATDGEHPPVYIPSLNSGDNRCSMSKALRGSTAEQRLGKIPTLQRPTVSEEKASTHRSSIKNPCQSNKTSPAHTNSPKSSPGRIPSAKSKTQSLEGAKHPVNGASDEQWIDGPRISKSKVAEARHLMKEPCHVKKRETWIDGPMQAESPNAYGYMDSHKKNMIRKWVEHQTSQIRKQHPKVPEPKASKEPFKELTQFKTCEDDVLKPLDSQKHESIEESFIRTGLKLSNGKGSGDAIPECQTPEERDIDGNKAIEEELEDDEEAVEIPPALPLIQPLSSREVSLESLDNLLKERLMCNPGYCNRNAHDNDIDEILGSDEDEILEIIEVEEPLEPVPTQDCCLQVTEEDIAFCMGILENPLPEVDQENPLDHPLRILSQENLTVVSTFTDSMSVYTDLERILPRHRYDPKYGLYSDDYEDPDNPYQRTTIFDEASQQKFNQLARLHEMYSNRLAKANVTNSEMYQQLKHNQKSLTRCESLSLSDMLYGVNGLETSSIYSEPAYVPNEEKFCENCKVSMSRPATAQNWYDDAHLSISSTELATPTPAVPPLGRRFQRYCHKYVKDGGSLAHLRHPDGASNPNLREESERIPGNGASAISAQEQNYTTLTEDAKSIRPLTPPNSLPSTERINRKIMSIEAGLTSIKLNQKHSEEYDSGHDSTPRTSKHSPAAISRRAESGYDSVVRDSESSSIDSDTSRLSHLHNRRGKCKHKHDKSFCSWFLHPFTCKYIDEPPETHF